MVIVIHVMLRERIIAIKNLGTARLRLFIKILILLTIALLVNSCALIGGAKEYYRQQNPLRKLSKQEGRVQQLSLKRVPFCKKLKAVKAKENKHESIGHREFKIASAKHGANAYSNIVRPEMFISDYRIIDIYKCDLEKELALAVSQGKTVKVHEAINLGANINYQDSNGETVLFIAARKKLYRTFQLLLNLGADYEIQNNQGQKVYEKYP